MDEPIRLHTVGSELVCGMEAHIVTARKAA